MLDFKKIMDPLSFAFGWNKALDAASQGQYNEALEYIERIETISKKMPGSHILKVFLLYSLQQDEDCIFAAREAKNVVKNSKKYSGEETAYLLCYISTWAKASASRTGCTNEFDTVLGVEKIDLNQVRNHLKRNFPLRLHPRWVGV